MTRSAAELAVIGGSSAFFPALAQALLDRHADLPPLRVRLLGRDRRRLDTVVRACEGLARAAGVDHRFTGTTNLDAAVDGVEVVLCQPRIGGFAGRTHDETFPLRFGFPGDETIGPGGLASLLRGFSEVLRIARAVERRAPSAWFVNLTNPMGMLTGALLRHTSVRGFGLCELPQRTLDDAVRLLGGRRGTDAVHASHLGVNHQGWFVRIVVDGEDVLDEVLGRIATLERGGGFGVDGLVMQRLGALPLRYLRLFHHRQRVVAEARDRDRGAELAALSSRLLARYEEDGGGGCLPPELAERDTSWNALAVVPALVALLGGPPAELYVSLQNRGSLPFLPADAVVERRARVTAAGAAALEDPVAAAADASHPRLAALLRDIVEFEQRALAAAESGAPADVVAALVAHPFGIDDATAHAMLPDVLRPVEPARGAARPAGHRAGRGEP